MLTTVVGEVAVVVVAVGMAAVVGNHRGGRPHLTTVNAEYPLEGGAELLREPAVEDKVAGGLDSQQAVADELEEPQGHGVGQVSILDRVVLVDSHEKPGGWEESTS